MTNLRLQPWSKLPGEMIRRCNSTTTRTSLRRRSERRYPGPRRRLEGLDGCTDATDGRGLAALLHATKLPDDHADTHAVEAAALVRLRSAPLPIDR